MLDSTLIDDNLKPSYEIRDRNFSPDIYFFAPTLKRYESKAFCNSDKPVFVPISLTGSSCALDCKHCGGKLLESMYWVDSNDELIQLVHKLHKKGLKGLLITGGSCIDGSIPMKPFLPTLRKLKEDLNIQLAAHTGLVDKETANKMRGVFDIAMMDMIGRQETIQEIYNLHRKPEDFYKSLENILDQGISIVPHIVIGLHYGSILGEFDVLEKLTSYDLSTLVFVIVENLKNTVFDKMKIKPPPVTEIRELFKLGRLSFPEIPVLLGCAKPGGEMEIKIDRVAIMAGFNGIAYPCDDAIDFSKRLGLNVHFSEYCCSFVFRLMKT